MPDTIEFTVHVADQSVKDILVARLSEAGATGFEEEKTMLKAFLPLADENEKLFEEIIETNNLKYSKSIIIDRNWNSLWEVDFQPVTIGKFCRVRAVFHPPDAAVEHDIIITPKMSFGTGHHATTWLMIQAMGQLDFKDKTVFDFGTGTGVLAVLAEQCGSLSVTAIDNDEWSINNAVENFNINNCCNVLIYNNNGFVKEEKYDIILANINRNIILEEMEEIQQHLVKNGVVLLSGLLIGDEAVIVQAAGRNRLALKQKTEMNGWICLLMVNLDIS
jgi:ribosomal protein L11 methyltransferase